MWPRIPPPWSLSPARKRLYCQTGLRSSRRKQASSRLDRYHSRGALSETAEGGEAVLTGDAQGVQRIVQGGENGREGEEGVVFFVRHERETGAAGQAIAQALARGDEEAQMFGSGL